VDEYDRRYEADRARGPVYVNPPGGVVYDPWPFGNAGGTVIVTPAPPVTVQTGGGQTGITGQQQINPPGNAMRPTDRNYNTGPGGGVTEPAAPTNPVDPRKPMPGQR
jgi:hypothetical protein